MRYKVYYEGFYVIEADSIEEAMSSDRDDCEYEEWENTEAFELEENDATD